MTTAALVTNFYEILTFHKWNKTWNACVLFSWLGLDVNSIKTHFFSKSQCVFKLPFAVFLAVHFLKLQRCEHNICDFVVLHFISSQQYVFTMQKQHSKRNFCNISYSGLQDHEEVKSSPDFNLINIWYKIKQNKTK